MYPASWLSYERKSAGAGEAWCWCNVRRLQTRSLSALVDSGASRNCQGDHGERTDREPIPGFGGGAP